ncbi:hypothetical protein Pmar_PMAR022150 [Perkinsus marinus ATCC 50983]|uniref:Uncharacterized protein n=1 Tax=Perkinsus marinus (strain ATCC 50983 / TXsc) TaxID=423536 RepID=C5L0R1_PERM5|nr:hypothetical protein Pmar_PMAR022150 [Perkinsus marinus ATCC 50983]EER09713.1 hypothetical protein Pmar_PMAR022150 [Perkinsus marinus ATCC 50983]|eukprot:XP_002777918.1 hypothetical protein Pmar_PMAR022150 [Perkinsus marinus ATCC 50983]
MSGITVVDIIRDVSRTSEDTTRRETDKVALIAQPTSQQEVGMAASQRSVKEFNEQEIKKTFQPDDWKPVRSSEKGQRQKAEKVVGAVVEYNDEVKGKALIAKVAEDGHVLPSTHQQSTSPGIL